MAPRARTNTEKFLEEVRYFRKIPTWFDMSAGQPIPPLLSQEPHEMQDPNQFPIKDRSRALNAPNHELLCRDAAWYQEVSAKLERDGYKGLDEVFANLRAVVRTYACPIPLRETINAANALKLQLVPPYANQTEEDFKTEVGKILNCYLAHYYLAHNQPASALEFFKDSCEFDLGISPTAEAWVVTIWTWANYCCWKPTEPPTNTSTHWKNYLKGMYRIIDTDVFRREEFDEDMREAILQSGDDAVGNIVVRAGYHTIIFPERASSVPLTDDEVSDSDSEVSESDHPVSESDSQGLESDSQGLESDSQGLESDSEVSDSGSEVSDSDSPV